MKKMNILTIFFIFLVFGCVKTDEVNGIEQQMEEAEQYFSNFLSKENISAVYPNRLVLEKGGVAENWPAFFNAGNAETEVKIETKCDNDFEVEQSLGYFKVGPLEHRSLAVKLKANENTKSGTSYCEVKFFEQEKEIAKNSFIVVVK